MNDVQQAATPTPGPWNQSAWTIRKGDKFIADALEGTPELLDPTGEAWANARLISAAPDLLDALERVTVVAEHYMPDDDHQGPGVEHEALHEAWRVIRAARAAIRKAREER
jgi:hypothetical protein